jgi:AraC-like DNA-binding protein
MARVKERNLAPDPAYFERLVAKALLFRRTERIVTEQRFGGYRANIVTYAVAKLAHATGQRIDLSDIWQAQALSPALDAAVTELSHLAFEVIAERTPNGANVTEWSKREQCWVLLRELPWEPSSQLSAVLIGRGKRSGRDPRGVDPEHIAAATSPGGDGWLSIANWAKETDNLTPWQRRFAYTTGVQLQRGRELSAKQAAHAVRILEAAKRVGFDPTTPPIPPTKGGHDDASEDPHAGPSADEIKSFAAENEALAQEPGPASQKAVANEDVLVEDVLSPHASNVLRRIGLKTLGEVAARTDGELVAAPDLGDKILAEIELVLAVHGLQLADTTASTDRDVPFASSSLLEHASAVSASPPSGRAPHASRDEEVGRLRAEGLTLQAIADTIGVTRERVRQILTASGQDVTQEYLSQMRREERREDARQHMEQLVAAFRTGRSIRDVAGELGIAGDAAVEVVDAAVTPADRAERGRNSRRASSGPTYAEDDLIAAVRRVADEVGRVPSSNDYGRLAGRLGLPSLPTLTNRLGGWSAAVRWAGMVPNQSRRSYKRTWGERACWMALEALVDELGQFPTVDHYDALAASREDLPSLATVRNRLGRWSEVAATLARGERPSESIDEEASEEVEEEEASRPKPADRPARRRSDLDPARRLLRQLRELPDDLRSELVVAAQDAAVDQALQSVLMASVTGQPGLASELHVEATEQQLDRGLMRVGEQLHRPMVRRIAYALQVRGAERPARALLRET